MKVAVIGAGPAGITAAYALAKQGIEVHVFEAGETPGGMAKTICLWNQRVDLGPHRFFSKDKRVNDLWLEVVGSDYKVVRRLTRILYKQKFYTYPLSPLNALSNLGMAQSVVCVLYYLKESIVPTKQDGGFEAWVTRRFGRRLFDIFFRPYSEKLWGMPCSQIDADFASQRIKKLSLSSAIFNAFFKDKFNKHRTLLEQFAYPCQGTGSVYQRMADFVEKHNGKVFYKTPVDKVMLEGDRTVGLALADGKACDRYDHIISTMPLSLLVSRLENVPEDIQKAAQGLKFRNTILVYLNVDSTDLFPDQWIYVQSPEVKTGRITNFRNWVPEMYGDEKTSIVAMEYWCNDEDALWRASSEELIELASSELEQLKFKKGRIMNGDVVRIPRCYPVYFKGYRNNLKMIQSYLEKIKGMMVIGRYGAFKYNNQDHSILMGLLAANYIGKGEKVDLWAVNTDYEEYQESIYCPPK